MPYLKDRINLNSKAKEDEKEDKKQEVYKRFAGEFLKKNSARGALISYNIHHWFL